MANALNQDQLSQIVQAVISALQVQGTAPKPSSIPAPVDKLAQRDAAIRAGFKRRGVTDVVLMDRNDPSKPFNIKPFKAWLEQGRMVKKGERSVKGLFHISQTSELPKPSAKPSPAKGKAKGKPQLVA
jgi:hypothetical protein